ncbi:MAG: alpha/beta fold hydrolase [Propionibacteriaceae bacterium]|jgi:pimeloyl-ACP methyl ester carboxylesterase|nr:alpha/beta fold hydrolase [Propionibacteriaceae bacterium]
MTTPYPAADQPAGRLHTTALGVGPTRHVFCHGLFGQGRNWWSIARRLEPAASLLVDLPDHGRSPWSDRFDYPAMAQAVAAELAGLESDDLTLVGHSMGGKTAMLTALAHPGLVRRLVVVDTAPCPTPDPGLDRLLQAMLSLDTAALSSRHRAEQALTTVVHDPRTRQFLLAGYQRTPTGGGWRFNLPLLARDLDQVMGWPAPGPLPPYPGPVLWLVGGDSDRIPPQAPARMAQLFPRHRRQVIPAAGHWVHTDQPEAFLKALTDFMAADQ